jgi:hypothetical protein
MKTQKTMIGLISAAILLMLAGSVYATSYNLESCEDITLKTGDSCTASDLENLEGVRLYAYKGSKMHVLEITNIYEGKIDLKDLNDRKNYADMRIVNGKLRVGSLGTIKVDLTGTTLTAVNLKLKKK